MSGAPLRLSPAVADALAAGRPVVALESTVIAHGLPAPDNLEVVRAMLEAVRAAGAEPAVTGLAGGALVAGLSDDEIARFAEGNAAKASRRDLAALLATGSDGATTVAATVAIAHLAGIPLIATGGIGGVHRGAADTMDVSADLHELARTPVAVVCSGAKAILDLPRTREVLETEGVPVIGYGTDEMPAFTVRGSGLPVDHRVDTAGQAAAVIAAQRALNRAGLLLANPVPEAEAIPRVEHDRWLDRALAEAAEQGVAGKALTPFLLDRLDALSGGRTRAANRTLLVANAALAGEVASALAARG